MNVFVLNTGRCGSTTFTKACQHITNFTSDHESRGDRLGEKRFDYPKNHIESDNRLSWFLGRLDKHYGNTAFYVHLKRNNDDTAKSFVNRYSRGIINAYRNVILQDFSKDTPPISVSLDYCDTVNSNIELFLKDKTRKMEFNLENAKEDFQTFFELIGAEGNIDAAISEFDVSYNSSLLLDNKQERPNLLLRTLQKLGRTIKKFPNFVKEA